MCLLPNLALSLPSVSPGKKTPRQGLGHRGSAWLPAGTWGQALRMPLQLGAGEGGGESLLIYLWPWHFPWGGALPRELGQMAFLGARSVSAAAATHQERLYLSSSQEAMKGEGFGEAGTFLGKGPRERELGPGSLYILCLSLWPCSWQVHVLPPPSPAKLHPCHGTSLGHPHSVSFSLFSPHLSFVWVLLPLLRPRILGYKALSDQLSCPSAPQSLTHTHPEDDRCLPDLLAEPTLFLGTVSTPSSVPRPMLSPAGRDRLPPLA